MRYLTTQEVADKLGITYLSVYFLIRDKELPAYRFKRNYRIRIEDLNKFIRDKKVEEKLKEKQ